MITRLHLFRAYLHYLRKPLISFLPTVAILLLIILVGGFAFHKLYEHSEISGQLTFLRACYITYCLIFMEHILPFPEHWFLQLLYFLLPIVGLVFVLEAIVELGYHVMRRDEHSIEWISSVSKTWSDHVILYGLGKVGFRILQKLEDLGENVVVLEKQSSGEHLTYAERKQIPVLVGTGRTEGIVDALNVEKAKSIILATNDDLANLELALDARKVNPSLRVVLRMYDQELAAKIQGAFDIELAFSTSELAAPLFATSSADRSIKSAFYVENHLFIVADIKISSESQYVGTQLGILHDDENFIVLRVERDGETQFHPTHDFVLQKDDLITLQTEPEYLTKFHQKNKTTDL